ncbi:MAG: 4-phosphoerythronate dehydrogenase [Fibrobacter sp.]|nr:4-phosphoerythronate dehydrogenase [Fibrobacter sp.]
MKVIADENIALVQDAFSGFGEIVTVPGREINRELLSDASILLVRSVTEVNKDLLDGTSVKFVASATIGVDHVDTKYLQENSIGFAYAPGSNSASVAEYVVAALLHISRKTGRPLEKMNLGIVGVGSIGSKVYHHAAALGLNCILNDPPKKRMTGSDIYVPMDTLLEKADIISFHVPLITAGEDTTYHMVNKEMLSRMKNNVILINTSRGKIIDEKIVRAQREKFDGLIFDVWENEPAINIETLKCTDIGTAHIAGYSYEGKLRGTQMIYDAACAFFFAKPEWRVPEGYYTDIMDRIDIRNSTEPVYDAVRSVYAIEKDSKNLSAIIQKSKTDQESYFDQLRKNYPRRREFPHFLIQCSNAQKKSAAVLTELGFKVEISDSDVSAEDSNSTLTPVIGEHDENKS